MGDTTAISNKFQYLEFEVDSLQTSFAGDARSDSKNWPSAYFSRQDFLPVGMKVISAEIPFVFDTLVEPYNYFVLNASTITIPPGNYTATTLASTLQSLMGGTFTVTYNNSTLKFTFTNTGAFTMTFDANSAKTFMGFSEGTFSSSGNVITSNKVANPSGPSYVYLNSKFLGPKVRHTTGDQSPSENQICKIPLNGNKGSIIFYNDPTPNLFFDLITNQKIVNFDLYLTLGDRETLVDLKGLGFNVKLGFLAYRDGGAPIGQLPSQRSGRTFFTP